jgi:hypothetical protein
VVVSLSVKHLGKVFAQEIAQKPNPNLMHPMFAATMIETYVYELIQRSYFLSCVRIRGGSDHDSFFLAVLRPHPFASFSTVVIRLGSEIIDLVSFEKESTIGGECKIQTQQTNKLQ